MAGSVAYYKRLARIPTITATLGYDDGSVQDLTGATIYFVLRVPGVATPKFRAQANIVGDATLGMVSYEIGATDFDTVGVFDQEWEVVLANSKVGHFPSRGYNKIVVADDLKADA